MASVRDIHNFDDQFKYQLDKVAEAEIDERDREAIQEFIRYQDTQRGLAASTNVNNCSDLRLSAERADTPLREMDRSDVDALLFEYKHDYEMAEGTLRNYRKALRKFFRYHDPEWAEDIEIGTIPDREVDTDKTLEEDEIQALCEAADHPRNKALLEILLDTGLRVSAVWTLRVQDVELNGRAGTVTLNPEAVGRKGASGKRPLTWSKSYVANWLDVHPSR
jgi:site-specific recombinase XerD